MSTHQHYLSAKNPHENNKNQVKKIKCMEKIVDFHTPTYPPPLRESVWYLCIHENVGIYRRPLGSLLMTGTYMS